LTDNTGTTVSLPQKLIQS